MQVNLLMLKTQKTGRLSALNNAAATFEYEQ